MVGHFLQVQSFSRSDLLDIIELSRLLKRAEKNGTCPKLLDGAALGTIDEVPQANSDTFLELAMTKLGGHVVKANPPGAEGRTREALVYRWRILSRLVNVIEASTLDGKTLTDLASQSSVPVINGQTRDNHPTQALADIMTMMEHSSKGKPLDELNLVFIGAATNICSSLMLASTRLGMQFIHVAPKRYQAQETWQHLANENCKKSGGTFSMSDDPLSSVKDADFVYIGLPCTDERNNIAGDQQAHFLARSPVNDTLLATAPPHARIMHCIPAERSAEISGTLLDGAQSIIFDQMENRLHASMGILARFVYPHLLRPSAEVRVRASTDIRRFISAHTEF